MQTPALSFCVPPEAEWQSGYAAACKAVDAGSIPTSASISSSWQGERGKMG